MNSARYFLFLHVLLLTALDYSCNFPQNAGSICGKNGLDGKCVPLRECPSAIKDLWKRVAIQVCEIRGSTLRVCCAEDNEVMPPIFSERLSYKDISYKHGGTCKPLHSRLQTSKVGAKAWNKCIEYLEDLVFPCIRSADGTWKRENQCMLQSEGLVVDGVTAGRGEFPFMALLGFIGDSGVDYRCGATIISDRFLLTAGHCAYYKGQVAKVKVGVQNRTETVDNKTQIYDVSNVIRHHWYRPPLKYHDVALVKTDRRIIFNHLVRPACLHTGKEINDRDMTVVGWGSTVYNGPLSDSLQKAKITKFTYKDCSRTYPMNRHMKYGLDPVTQVCYGDRRTHRDSCAGDSGGPILHQDSELCTYLVFGITSWGKRCGLSHTPGVYMKVLPYIGWIEKHVWA